MTLLLYLILLLVVFSAISVHKAVNLLSTKELKRRARAGRDKKAAAIYKMAAYEKSLPIFLLLVGCVAAAVLLGAAAHNSWWETLIVVAVMAWLLAGWHPAPDTRGWLWSWAAILSPVIAWLVGLLQPILRRLGRGSLPSVRIHTGVYEKEDLMELLRDQNNLPENRIPEPELRMAFNSLAFGDKKVTDVMTPLRATRLVSEDEQVGPLLMDELHKTGFSRFPVVRAGTAKAAQPQVVGTLFLKDLLGYTGSGSVGSLMNKHVYFINETQGLRDALAAFLKTHHHLFIVVNNFEEIVGVLSIEDVLEQIVGEKIVDEFDKYDDLRAVASIEAKKEQHQHDHVKTSENPAEQTAESVVN